MFNWVERLGLNYLKVQLCNWWLQAQHHWHLQVFHNPFSIEFQLCNHLHIQKPLLVMVCQGSNQGLKQLKAEFTYNSEKKSILIQLFLSQWPDQLILVSFQITPLLRCPQGPQGCLEKQNCPLSLNLAVWCAKIGPKLRNFKKPSKNPHFLLFFLSFLTFFRNYSF